LACAAHRLPGLACAAYRLPGLVCARNRASSGERPASRRFTRLARGWSVTASQPGAEPVPYVQTAWPASFNGLITCDGSSGYPAEAGRYQLYASLACPWSHRALIVRELLGLQQVIGLTLTDPIRDERGWRFPSTGGGADPITGARYISELYLA